MIDLSSNGVLEEGYGVIPEGEYPCIVDKLDWKENYDGTWKELNYQLRIVGDKYKNRVIFKKFDILNPDINVKKKTIDSMKRMTNVFGIEGDSFDEASIVGKNVNVMLSVYKTTKGDERNSIFYFKPFKTQEKNPGYLPENIAINSDPKMSGDDIPF